DRRRPGEALPDDAQPRHAPLDAHPQPGSRRDDDKGPDGRLGMRLRARHEFRLRLGGRPGAERCDRNALPGQLRPRRRFWHAGLARSDAGPVRDPTHSAHRPAKQRRIADAAGAAGGGCGDAQEMTFHQPEERARDWTFLPHLRFGLVITMPELPDIVVYIECLRPKVEGHTLDSIRLASPFLLRSVEPPISEAR